METENRAPGESDRHNLKNLMFEIQEADGTADDPDKDDFELELKIGFNRVRLTVYADGLKVPGNRIAFESLACPDDAEKHDAEFRGRFDIRGVGRDPLSYVFVPREDGAMLAGRLESNGRFVTVETRVGARVHAELSATREALKVRIVDPNGTRQASKSLSEQHREKMCAAVAKRSFGGSRQEYVLHRLPLAGGAV